MQKDILLTVNKKSRLDLTNLFNKKVSVEISPEAFVFSVSGNSISIKTYLLARKKKGEYIVAGVGDGFESESDCVKIELFNGGDNMPENVTLDDCLVSYMRYGLNEVFKGKFHLDPTVIFKNSHRIGHYLGGYHNLVLFTCASMAGAYSVEFEE